MFIVYNQFKKLNYWLTFFVFFAILFIIVPLFIVIYFALNAVGPEREKHIEVIDNNAVFSILRSLYISVVSLFFIVLLSYPTAYILSNIKNFFLKNLLVFLIISPLWSTFFVKLIGLKSFFDLWNGQLNSTYGIIYTIQGLIYMYLPISIITFFNSLNNIPKNLMHASSDLGSTTTESIWKIIIPYTKESIISSIILVFLPCFTTVTISEFLNLQPNSKMIGEVMNTLVSSSSTDVTARSRLSILTIFISFLVFLFYSFFKLIPKFVTYISWFKSKEERAYV